MLNDQTLEEMARITSNPAFLHLRDRIEQELDIVTSAMIVSNGQGAEFLVGMFSGLHKVVQILKNEPVDALRQLREMDEIFKDE